MTAADFELVHGLVEKLSSEDFQPEAYEGEYQNRVRAMLDNKVKGREITVPPPAPARGHIIDLMEALKESMKTVERGKKKADQKTRRKGLTFRDNYLYIFGFGSSFFPLLNLFFRT